MAVGRVNDMKESQMVEAIRACNMVLHGRMIPPPYSTHVSWSRWSAMVKRIAIDNGLTAQEYDNMLASADRF
jgi:hypothetical protein